MAVVNPPYAVAGADIEVGMTVILEPGGEPFVVQKLRPFTSPVASWHYVYNEQGKPFPVQKDAWYAEVEQS